MKLKDISITKQLSIGLSIILLAVVLLGITAFQDVNRIWETTQGLYEHPFTVQGAIGDVRSDILFIRVEMKEMALRNNLDTLPEQLAAIDGYEADIYQKLDILYGAYLGPREDVDRTREALIRWKPVRDETVRLLRAGQQERAVNRTSYEGDGGVHAGRVLDNLQVIDTYAQNKAVQFHYESMQLRNRMVQQLTIFFSLMLAMTLLISVSTQRKILPPLQELTAATEAFQQGRMDFRCETASGNEFGKLAQAFNAMASAVQAEFVNKVDAADISAAMSLHDDLHRFSRELLKVLMLKTDSQTGAIHLLNSDGTAYEHFESIGLHEERIPAFSATPPGGEFGLALSTGEIQVITDIPADTPFVFNAVSGDFRPRALVAVPISNGAAVVAVISLASLRDYSAPSLRLIRDIWREMSARLNGMLAFQQTKNMSLRVQQANTELASQAKELVMQADELTQQNIELEMQKKQLDEASRLKSAFLSNMSHELRTPLNSVIALTAVLNRRLYGTIPEEEYGYLDVIERNGKNLLALVNDILDLSRIEAGKEEVNVSAVNLHHLVDEILEMLKPQAAEKQIALINRVSESLPEIRSDAAMCRHILQNIIGNAVKFITAGSVEVSAVLSSGGIHLAISDTGIGITADQLHYIFDEFRQVDETISRKYGGTGLGLAIAKKYAELLQGDITVTSVPGEGSTFTVTLPLAIGELGSGQLSSVIEAPSEGDAKGDLPGKTILLVEDSEPAIIQMSDILKEQGYRVAIARNGKEALDSIAKALPDAMILDLMMPEVDGFQVLGAIRSLEETAHIPVLILTAMHVTKEELSFLKGNHIFQLIQKGTLGKTEILSAVRNMVWKTEKKLSQPHADTGSGDRRKPLVLIIEDNADNITTVRALLKDTCEVLEAADGIEGVEMASAHRPELILLDISLPGMDGFQILDELRTLESLNETSVIALTARVMSGDREEILKYGFDGYIPKPIDELGFMNTVRGVFDGTKKN